MADRIRKSLNEPEHTRLTEGGGEGPDLVVMAPRWRE
jgi:hypothetical protein